jgi:hypothetical protein
VSLALARFAVAARIVDRRVGSLIFSVGGGEFGGSGEGLVVDGVAAFRSCEVQRRCEPRPRRKLQRAGLGVPTHSQVPVSCRGRLRGGFNPTSTPSSIPSSSLGVLSAHWHFNEPGLGFRPWPNYKQHFETRSPSPKSGRSRSIAYATMSPPEIFLFLVGTCRLSTPTTSDQGDLQPSQHTSDCPHHLRVTHPPSLCHARIAYADLGNTTTTTTARLRQGR